MSDKPIFVVIQPGSNTNPTEKYRVCDAFQLTRYLNGAIKSYGYTEWNTYQEAEQARNIANKDV